MSARIGIDEELQLNFDYFVEDLTRESLRQLRQMSGNSISSLARQDDPSPERWQVQDSNRVVDCLIYRPDKFQNSAVLMWMHGGGYVMGNVDHVLAPVLAREVGCTVVSVDYRVAPEYPYPAGLEDCYSVLCEIAKKSCDTRD